MPLSCGGKEEPELGAALAADAAKLIPGEAVRHCLQARWCAPAARRKQRVCRQHRIKSAPGNWFVQP